MKTNYEKMFPHEFKTVLNKNHEKLFGSMRTKVKTSDYKKVRREAGKLLVKKYKVS